MARWDEERGGWEGERWRGREDRGGWRSDDTWRGGGWRERDDREREEARHRGEDWRRGVERWEGQERGGREWEPLRGRESGWGREGGRYGAGGGAYGHGGEWESERGGRGDEREGGEWRRTTQFDPSGEGAGSWGPGGRYGEQRDRFRSGERSGGEWAGARGQYGDEPGEWRGGRREWSGRGERDFYGGFMGRQAETWGEGRGEARSDFGRGHHPYHGRSDWGRGGEDERGHMGLGERMREGWRKLTGQGPKGYKRSDERIREDVSERIARSSIDAHDVEVKVDGGEVTLSGFVESRWDKRMLEDMADEVFGVDEVHNHLRIRRETRVELAEQGGRTAPAQTYQAGMSGETVGGQRASQAGTSGQPTGGQRPSQQQPEQGGDAGRRH